MIVIRPGMGALHPAALLVLVAATSFGVYQVLARYVSDQDSPATTLAYTAIVGAVLLSAVVPFIWQWPSDPVHLAVFIGLGVWAAVAEFCVVKAFDSANAAVVAPFQYTLLLWGTVYGFILFGDLPDEWTLLGAAIVVATGLYAFHQERSAIILSDRAT